MKYATMCVSCNRRFFIEFPYEYRCLICNAKAIKPKRKLTKLQRKRRANFSNRFKYAELKISVICMDVMQLYRESNPNLIAAILLLLKKSKLNFNDDIFEKYCNMLDNLGSSVVLDAKGVWVYGYEALRLVKWLQSDKYYDNINYFDLIYTIMNKDKNVKITLEVFESINELTK